MVKTRRSKCTTKFGTRCLTEVFSLQLVQIDGIPRNVKDLRPYPLSSDESDTEESE